MADPSTSGASASPPTAASPPAGDGGGLSEEELAALGIKARKRPIQVASCIGRVMEMDDESGLGAESSVKRQMATPSSPAAQAAMESDIRSKGARPSQYMQYSVSKSEVNRETQAPHQFMGSPGEYSAAKSSEPKLHSIKKKTSRTGKPINAGFLKKQGAKRKNWKNRWFVLDGHFLMYFAKKGDPSPIATIHITPSCNIQLDSRNHSFVLHTEERDWHFIAENDTQKDRWYAPLFSPFCILVVPFMERPPWA
eukprot:TRINITY_DN4814_c0_g1_i5.p1 TRINITY_DN4814_c0_g1~~TRINITY_DN4814_c0_g1_i5.p1  ORF type:complete len:263 (+),score=56.39 TRINITY_DN4814_c0_g1_i5:31-789(+)